MKELLGKVRNLSLITHFFMMQVNFPPNVMIFFSGIFEFVTFDLVPSEKIYALFISLEESPFSEEAGEIGYEYHQFIPNTGTVTLFIFM